MKVLGKTKNGFIVEMGEHELGKLIAFTDERRKAEVGDTLDVHSAIAGMAKADSYTKYLRRASAELARAADDIDGLSAAGQLVTGALS